ncbi:25451_t:CDS:2, partial [Gigaspora margarita]
MSAPESYQFSSYNSDTISWSNKNELDESNELNDLNSSNISENIHDLDTALNSSSPDQVLLHNSGITVTNIKIKDKNGLKKECGNKYGLTTGTGNLKSHFRQKLLGASIDNTSSMIKAMDQLGVKHIGKFKFTYILYHISHNYHM